MLVLDLKAIIKSGAANSLEPQLLPGEIRPRGFPQAVRTRPQGSGITLPPRSLFHSFSCYREATVARRALCYFYPAGSRGGASVRMPDYVSLWPRRSQTPGLSIGSAPFLLLRHHEA